MNLVSKNSFSSISATLRHCWRGFLFLFAFLMPIECFAAVFINEIAWMGTSFSSNDEWIELYNDSNNDINLSGWKIISKDGKITINLDGKIAKNSFYLLERTDDNSVPGLPADKVYTGALSNNGETLEIYDNFGKIVNSVDCSSGWLGGDNTTKKTMERNGLEDNLTNWSTSINEGGTPGAKNSISNNQIGVAFQKIKTDSPQTEKKTTKTYSSGIIINEFLPSPEGNDEENEWIEIYNQNAEKIDLSEWKLKDSKGKSTTFIFPDKTFIDAFGFLIFSRNATKIILNNDNDEISLINPDGKSVDKVSYSKAPINQSYSKINDEWVWNSKLTPGSKNISNSSTLDNNSVAKNTGNKTVYEKNNLASIGLQISKKIILIPLIAILLATISGGIILFIKKKLNE